MEKNEYIYQPLVFDLLKKVKNFLNTCETKRYQQLFDEEALEDLECEINVFMREYSND